MSINALIVDSSQYNRDMLAHMLTIIGVNCVVHSTGQEALSMDSNRLYDFIIVSRTLDDMGADRFLLHFREHQQMDDVLTIMLTSKPVSEVSTEANKAGFKLVFNKKDFAVIQDFLLEAVKKRVTDLNASILYVEDDPMQAKMLSSLLKAYQASVDHCAELESAKEAVERNDYDLIISDYYLSDNNTGGDLIDYVRSLTDSDKARTPILIVTAETSQEKRTSFLRNGANDFIIKPFDQDELVARASNLASHKKLYDEFRKQQKELLKLAMSDQLTGIYNRRSLFEFGPKYVSDAQRHGNPVSLLVIDADRFKSVNDNYGHAAGDEVLKNIANVLQNSCRNEDFVARFGGEEFVMLLPHCTLDDAVLKADSIRKRVGDECSREFTVTVSIGVAELAPDDDLDVLFKKADAAVYKAKNSGRNRVEALRGDLSESNSE